MYAMGLYNVVRGAGRNMADGRHTFGVTIQYLLPIYHSKTPINADVVPIN